MDSLLIWFKDGIPADPTKLKDVEFKRSHVRPRTVIVDRATQLDTSIDPRRSLFANIPIGGNDLLTGLPSGNFDEDVFSLWPYVKVHGNWSNPLFTAPAAYTDAAHKHGVSVLSSWFFEWDWEYIPGKTKAQDGNAYKIELMTKKDSSGSYIYAKPIMDIMQYFGMDGINYNSECFYSSASSDMKALHQKLYDIAQDRSYSSFHIGWYNSVSNNGRNHGSRFSLSNNNDEWFYDSKTGKFVSDVFMLDYGWGETQLKETVNRAKAIGAPNGALDVYGGMWLVQIKPNFFPSLDIHREVSIALWGEHKLNRFFQHRSGVDLKSIQKNYQDRLEWFFSGKTQNPKDAEASPILSGGTNSIDNDAYLKNFHGIAKHITERSTVQGSLPFATSFNLGNGLNYYDRSIKTLGSWYNLSAQDMTPTYRWLITDASGNAATNVKASFSHDEAWMGGSSLLLRGTAKTTATDITLYRTLLTTKKQNAYSVKPVTPMDFTVEAVNECATLVDLKMVWSMSSENKKRLVYNDEVNVDHFEIWIKEPGKDRKMVAHTASWAHYLPKYQWPDFTATTFEVGVRAVAQDLTTTSDMAWQTVTRNPAASAIECAGGAVYCEAVNDLGQAQDAHLSRYFDSAYTVGASANIKVYGKAPITPGLEGYASFLNDTIKVSLGTTFTFVGEATQGMQWCKYRVYVDWDGDGEFNPVTEMVFSGGKDNAGDKTVCHLNIPVTVPGNAVSGVTRMRIRYADAWVAHPGACGMVSGGYTADFCILVAGNGGGGSTSETPDSSASTPPAFKGPALNAASPSVYVVYKLDSAAAGTESNLLLLLKKKNAAAPTEYPLGVATLEGWNEANILLSDYSETDTIVSIGLRVKSATGDVPVKVRIGELKLLPGSYQQQKVTVNAAQEITDFTITSAIRVVGQDTLVYYGSEFAFTFKINAAVAGLPVVTINGAPMLYSYDAITGVYAVRIPGVAENLAVSIATGEARTVTVNTPAEVEVLSASAPEMKNSAQRYMLARGSAFTFAFRMNAKGYYISKVTIGSTPYALASPSEQGVYSVTTGVIDTDTSITVTVALQRFAVSVAAGAHVSLQTSASDTVEWGSAATVRFTLDAGYNPAAEVDGAAQTVPAPDAAGVYTIRVDSVKAAVSVKLSANIQQFDVTLTRESGRITLGTGTAVGTKKVNYGSSFPFSYRVVDGYLPVLRVNGVETPVGAPDASGLYRDTVYNITAATAIDITSKLNDSGSEAPTGVSAVAADAPNFYPNPANDVLTFVNTDKVSIYTISGYLVGVYTTPTVNVSHLPVGVYMVKMQRGSHVRTARLVKN